MFTGCTTIFFLGSKESFVVLTKKEKIFSCYVGGGGSGGFCM